MAKVTETPLPGVGVRYEFVTGEGEQVAVLYHHSGRREIVIYDRDDPDLARSVLRLDEDDARTVTELLGATQVSEVLRSVQQQIEGLALDWIEILEHSPLVGHTIGEGRLRTRTGASVVALVRGTTTEPAPGPDFVFEPGDVAVAVGTAQGLAELRDLLRG